MAVPSSQPASVLHVLSGVQLSRNLHLAGMPGNAPSRVGRHTCSGRSGHTGLQSPRPSLQHCLAR